MLMLGAETIFVINPTLYGSKLAYDPKDFAYHRARSRQPGARASFVRAKTVGELIELAKQKPERDQLRHLGHRLGAACQRRAARKHGGHQAAAGALPGAAPALNGVVAGHVQLLSVAVASALQPWRSGLVKMLAIGSQARAAW